MGVGGLVVVDCRRKRHEQRGSANRCQLGHGAGTGPRHDQVGGGIGHGGVVDERREFGIDTGCRVIGTQRVDLLRAALVQHDRAQRGRHQRKRFRHHRVECRGTQAATDHQQLERAAASREPNFGARLRQKARAQRVAHATGVLQYVREGAEHAVGHARKHPVGQARDRVLLMQHQRLAEQHAHHAGRKSDVAPETKDHIGPHATNHADALPERAQQPQRQQQQRQWPLATHATELHRLERKAAWRHQLLLHAAGRAQPVNLPAART